MFSINCLEITATKAQWEKSKSLYKNLLSEKDFETIDPNVSVNKRFFFNEFYYHDQNGNLRIRPKEEKTLPDNFFGKNINIQAIVGKNGSGKSTLMDLMYVAINNYANILTHLLPKPLHYALGVWLKLYFIIDGNEYFLEIAGQKTSLRKINRFNDIVKIDPIIKEDFDIENFIPLGANREHAIANKFFYTIVSNYAALSLIPSNYRCNCLELARLQGPNLDNQWLANSCIESWIQRIFHKNDGYTCPIVLNPMRNEGSIDVEKEIQLSKYRLLSLLIYAKRNNFSFDNRYKLKKIDVHFRFNFTLNKLKQNWSSLKDQDEQGICRVVEKWLIDPNSITNIIISKFNLKIKYDSLNIKKLAIAYLQDKILSLPKYHSYSKFSTNGSEDLKTKDIDNVNVENFKNLLEDICQDSSHIVTKIHQVINFLSIKDNDEMLFIHDNETRIFDYEKIYEKAIRNQIKENKKEWNKLSEESNGDFFATPFIHIKPWKDDFAEENRDFSLDEIIECLPPSFFNYDIWLYDSVKKTDVLYNKMSAGELQLFQIISTHLYHIRNIISVNGVRQHYKNINLIFDELEICFHPEYQRIFVKKFIDILNNLKFNEFHTFNIFLITHSPFILSDIPKSNVLFMQTDEDKENIKKIPTHTFAQNIGDMMYSSFFMEKTIGEFAESKLKELIRFKQGKNSSMLQSEADAILKSIGDPVIRSLIEEIEANND